MDTFFLKMTKVIDWKNINHYLVYALYIGVNLFIICRELEYYLPVDRREPKIKEEEYKARGSHKLLSFQLVIDNRIDLRHNSANGIWNF